MGKYFEIIFIYETTVSFKTNLAGIFHRSHVSEITFICYVQSQMIESQIIQNLGSKNTKGHKLESQNRTIWENILKLYSYMKPLYHLKQTWLEYSIEDFLPNVIFVDCVRNYPITIHGQFCSFRK
jgi:hypothetical protein